MEFNEICVLTGESAHATVITLCNELRPGERRAETEAVIGLGANGSDCVHMFRTCDFRYGNTET